ncbi:MAG: hypothetical protein RR034_02300 [Bacteroidales bacterium]
MKRFFISITLIFCFISLLVCCRKDDDFDNYPPVEFSCNGSIILKCLSTNPYSVTINDRWKYTLQGKETLTVTGFEKGFYSISVEQLSGYILYPTTATYTGTMSCNGTLSCVFPDRKAEEEK